MVGGGAGDVATDLTCLLSVVLASLLVSWQPCFVGKVSSLGHTWAAAITCPAV